LVFGFFSNHDWGAEFEAGLAQCLGSSEALRFEFIGALFEVKAEFFGQVFIQLIPVVAQFAP
jgi:hypothetical protein